MEASKVLAAGVSGRQAGFTLIRALVSLAIAGSLLAAASPNIATALRIYSVRSGARQVYSELQNLRVAAVTENRGYTFTINGGGTSYSVQPAGGAAVSKVLDSGSQGVTISAANPITFASNGSAPANGTVTVANSSGSTIQVAVGPAGRVRVQ